MNFNERTILYCFLILARDAQSFLSRNCKNLNGDKCGSQNEKYFFYGLFCPRSETTARKIPRQSAVCLLAIQATLTGFIFMINKI